MKPKFLNEGLKVKPDHELCQELDMEWKEVSLSGTDCPMCNSLMIPIWLPQRPSWDMTKPSDFAFCIRCKKIFGHYVKEK